MGRKVGFAIGLIALVALAVPAGLAAHKALARTGDDPAEAARDAAIRRHLDTAKLTLNFDEVPAGEAADFMADLVGTKHERGSADRSRIFQSFATRSCAERKLALQLRDVSAAEALRRFEQASPGLRTTVVHGFLVFHGTPEIGARFPAAVPATAQACDELECAAPFSCDWSRASLDDVLADLTETSGLRFKSDGALPGGVSLHLKDVRFDDALQILCTTHDLHLGVAGDHFVLESTPAGPPPGAQK